MYWFQPMGGVGAVPPDRHPIYIHEDGRRHAGLRLPGDRRPGRRGEGGVLPARVACTPDTIDREVHPDEIEEMAATPGRVLPTLPGRFLNAATCMYTTTPDQHFVIATHPQHRAGDGGLRVLRARLQVRAGGGGDPRRPGDRRDDGAPDRPVRPAPPRPDPLTPKPLARTGVTCDAAAVDQGWTAYGPAAPGAAPPDDRPRAGRRRAAGPPRRAGVVRAARATSGSPSPAAARAPGRRGSAAPSWRSPGRATTTSTCRPGSTPGWPRRPDRATRRGRRLPAPRVRSRRAARRRPSSRPRWGPRPGNVARVQRAGRPGRRGPRLRAAARVYLVTEGGARTALLLRGPGPRDGIEPGVTLQVVSTEPGSRRRERPPRSGAWPSCTTCSAVRCCPSAARCSATGRRCCSSTPGRRCGGSSSSCPTATLAAVERQVVGVARAPGAAARRRPAPQARRCCSTGRPGSARRTPSAT